jgi:tRNA(fMet)-specific endonuclease VapC
MRYMLDTNAVSHLIRKHSAMVARVMATPMASICISSITEGELLFGLAKRPAARQLQTAVHEFLKRVAVLPWDSAVAAHYGMLRAELEAAGRPLAPLDMLIGAHAARLGTVLVTSDKAFRQLSALQTEDWTSDQV